MLKYCIPSNSHNKMKYKSLVPLLFSIILLSSLASALTAEIIRENLGPEIQGIIWLINNGTQYENLSLSIRDISEENSRISFNFYSYYYVNDTLQESIDGWDIVNLAPGDIATVYIYH